MNILAKPRRKRSLSPTQRTLAWLRARGYTCAITERWNPHAHIRQDLYGFCDVLAMQPGVLIAVQACAGSSAAARVSKIRAEARAALWLECPTRKVWVMAWSKRGARGKRKLWAVRIIDVQHGGSVGESIDDVPLPHDQLLSELPAPLLASQLPCGHAISDLQSVAFTAACSVAGADELMVRDEKREAERRKLPAPPCDVGDIMVGSDR